MSTYEDKPTASSNAGSPSSTHAPLPKRVGDAGKPKGTGPAPKPDLGADRAEAEESSRLALGASLELAAKRMFEVADEMMKHVNAPAGSQGAYAQLDRARKAFDQVSRGSELERIRQDCENVKLIELPHAVAAVNSGFTRIDRAANAATTLANHYMLPGFDVRPLEAAVKRLNTTLVVDRKTLRGSSPDKNLTADDTLGLQLRAARASIKWLRDALPSETLGALESSYMAVFTHVSEVKALVSQMGSTIAQPSKVAIRELSKDLDKLIRELKARPYFENRALANLRPIVDMMRNAVKP